MIGWRKTISGLQFYEQYSSPRLIENDLTIMPRVANLITDKVIDYFNGNISKSLEIEGIGA